METGLHAVPYAISSLLPFNAPDKRDPLEIYVVFGSHKLESLDYNLVLIA